MKVLYKTAGKRLFKFSVWPVIAIGYYSQYFSYDEHQAQSYQTWYFLCFKLTATQFLRKFNQNK